MFNNDDDNENINNEKILPDDAILIDDYSIKEEKELDVAINVDKDSDNSEENSNNINNLILNKLSEEKDNNNLWNIFLKYQTVLRDTPLDE